MTAVKVKRESDTVLIEVPKYHIMARMDYETFVRFAGKIRAVSDEILQDEHDEIQKQIEAIEEIPF